MSPRKEIVRNWYRLKAPIDAGAAAEVYIYGEIGWQVTADQFVQDLREVAGPTTPLTVYINSPGGSVWDGLAIHNTLKRRTATVTVHIDGIALSMGSAIAMAGDFVVMPENALMMIHDPSWCAYGTAEEMRKQADVLDQIRDSLVGIYTAKTGKSAEDIAALMAEETWMTGAQAVEAGFADEVAAPVQDLAASAQGFDLSNCRQVPESLRGWAARKASADAEHDGRKTPMTTKTKPGSAVTYAAPTDDVAVTTPAPAAQGGAAAGVDADALREAATAAERKRVTDIQAAVRKAKLPADFAEGLIRDGVSVEEARARIIDQWAEADQSAPQTRNQVPAVVTGDAVDRFREGAELALMMRAGLAGGQHNELTGLTLRELARESLEVRNVKTRGMAPMNMIGVAFAPMMAGHHTTSDFANVLANVANKAMLIGYEEAGETFPQWTARGTLTDFKPTKRVDLNLFDALAEIPDGAEYTYGTVGDRGVLVQLATYGKLFAITRQTIINDDVDAFTRVPRKMGRAAIRTVGNLVYAVLTANPTMGDGRALFHADHKNLGSAAAPSTAAFDAMRTAMGTQQDPEGKATALNISPAFILVPKALEGTSKAVISAEYDSAKGDKKVPNSVRDMAEVIADGRLDKASTTAWYGAADPNMTDTVEVSYLDGNEAPYLESKHGWSVDGVEMKVRLDAGVNPLAHEGLYKNPGA